MSKKETVKSILALQRGSLARTGTLTYKGKKFTDLTDVGVQVHLRSLNISHTPITSLTTLPEQKNLNRIIADGSALDTYADFSKFKRVKRFSAVDTPLSKRKKFRVECVIMFGTILESINGTQVTQEEKQKAAAYPPIARYLLEKGWELADTVPNSEEFRELAIEYDLKVDGCNSDFSNSKSESLLRTGKSVYSCQADDEQDNENEQDKDEQLIEALVKELKKAGIGLTYEQDVKEEMIDIIRELAEAATILSDFKSEIQGMEDEEIAVEE